MARKARIDIWFLWSGVRHRILWPGLPTPGGDIHGRDNVDVRLRSVGVHRLTVEVSDNVGPALEAINDFMATIDVWKDVAHPVKERKILYSPGYGAGWVTWSGDTAAQKVFMLTYQPFIDALEAGKPLDEEQFQKDYQARFPDADEPYTGGLGDLKVAKVTGKVRMTEYDGSEGYVDRGDDAMEWL